MIKSSQDNIPLNEDFNDNRILKTVPASDAEIGVRGGSKSH
jgi:hypothetical protein